MSSAWLAAHAAASLAAGTSLAAVARALEDVCAARPGGRRRRRRWGGDRDDQRRGRDRSSGLDQLDVDRVATLRATVICGTKSQLVAGSNQERAREEEGGDGGLG